MDDVIVWHDDGHFVELRLQRDVLVVTGVRCPGEEERECIHPQTECVVEWFLRTYGLDCHVGVCPPAESLSVAWSLVGNPGDLEDSQIWIVATTDELYRSWKDAQIS